MYDQSSHGIWKTVGSRGRPGFDTGSRCYWKAAAGKSGKSDFPALYVFSGSGNEVFCDGFCTGMDQRRQYAGWRKDKRISGTDKEDLWGTDEEHDAAETGKFWYVQWVFCRWLWRKLGSQYFILRTGWDELPWRRKPGRDGNGRRYLWLWNAYLSKKGRRVWRCYLCADERAEQWCVYTTDAGLCQCRIEESGTGTWLFTDVFLCEVSGAGQWIFH